MSYLTDTLNAFLSSRADLDLNETRAKEAKQRNVANAADLLKALKAGAYLESTGVLFAQGENAYCVSNTQPQYVRAFRIETERYPSAPAEAMPADDPIEDDGPWPESAPVPIKAKARRWPDTGPVHGDGF